MLLPFTLFCCRPADVQSAGRYAAGEGCEDEASAVRDTTPQAVQACHELLLWLIPQLDKFPRVRRFTLGERLEAATVAWMKRSGIQGDLPSATRAPGLRFASSGLH